jgi:hypothetical protein
VRRDGVRRPLHEAWLGRNPAEREADLIDEANAAHGADRTRPEAGKLAACDAFKNV